MAVERCPDCAAPVHRVKVYKGKFVDGRWYATCRGCETDDWVPPDSEGWYGRRTWEEAFAIGVAHQLEMKA
jgi:hypothetical protein